MRPYIHLRIVFIAKVKSDRTNALKKNIPFMLSVHIILLDTKIASLKSCHFHFPLHCKYSN